MTNKKKPVAKQGIETGGIKPVPPPQKPVYEEPEFNEKSWTFSIGLYPGILLGIRTYEEADFKTHVLYLPFVDFALEIDN